MTSSILAAILGLAVVVTGVPAFAGGHGGNSNASYLNQDSMGGPRLFAPWPGYTGSPSEVNEARRSEAAAAERAATTPVPDTGASTPGASADRPSRPAPSK